jgi:hypothetical protein
MPQVRARCPHCREFVLATRPVFHHGPYVTASALTFGLLAPIHPLFYWMLTAPFRCTRCGYAVREGIHRGVLYGLIGAAAFAACFWFSVYWLYWLRLP